MTTSPDISPHSSTLPTEFLARIEAIYPQVHLAALALTRDPDTAQDVAQETFLRAWLKLDTLRSAEQLVPWLHRIARNLAFQWQRDGQNRSRLLPLIPMEDLPVDPVDNSTQTPREVAARREEAGIVQQAVMALPDDERLAVLLHYANGMSASDIARTTGEAVSTITRRLERARQALRGSMEVQLDAGLRGLKPSPKIARRSASIIAAAVAAPAAVRAQLAAAAADTVSATVAAAAASAIGSLTPAGSTLLTKGLTMATVATTVKIAAAAVLIGGGLFAVQSLTKGDQDTGVTIEQAANDSADTVQIQSVKSRQGGNSSPHGKGSYAAAAPAKSESQTSRTTRPDPLKRIATLADDLISTQPELVIKDGETSGKIYFNLLVVNESGLPIEGATVKMTGKRTSAKAHWATWYGWGNEKMETQTNPEGIARVWAPQFVDEQLDTFGVTFEVSHPDYASTDSDMRFDKITKVVLKSGWSLPVIVSDAESSRPLKSGLDFHFTSRFKPDWNQRPDGTVNVRKFSDEKLSFYVTHKADAQVESVSEMVTVEFPRKDDKPVPVTVYAGKTLRGRVSDNVPRPVQNGKVMAAHISGKESCAMHSRQKVDIAADGTFEFKNLPAGETMVWALADGWCSVVPEIKRPEFHAPNHPQVCNLTENNQQFVLEMEPTATVLFHLKDQAGNPVEGVQVSSWPNMCYENCCGLWVRDSFVTTSTKEGLAALPDIPAKPRSTFAVFGNYELPPRQDEHGRISRILELDLKPGQMLEQQLLVVPKGQTVITQEGDENTTR